MNEKKYLIDGEPASARDLFRKAEELDALNGGGGIFFTSVAAEVLRGNGHTVEYNTQGEDER